MSKFVLTAQIQLQAPKNANQIRNQIQSQLSGVNISVKLKAGQQAQQQLKALTAQTNKATTAADRLAKSFLAATKRFAAFTVASRAVSLFTNTLSNAVKEAIDFQAEIVKISQVTGVAVKNLASLERTISSLSVTLGVSSKELLSVGRVLSQAGIQARDLEVALGSLAKTTLAPTFTDIQQTAEGAIAILAQFGEGVGALERQLGAINRVAGQFAVESSDLIGAIRRTGGVFSAAGGSLEEFLGLFTSIRATTRESSESIATGLRTIFTRIQRPRTINFLKDLGVNLLDLNGKFVGPFEAAKRLSEAFGNLEQGDIKFIRIAEELGGFRQIGKVIPLLQQFETAEKARQAALEGGTSLTEDAEKAQQSLSVQIAKVREEFLALIRGFANTQSFQLFVRSSLALASALIKVADALKPLIPLIGAFAAVSAFRGIAGLAGRVGGGVRGFARGGFVPGQGNRDTVPAMLTPGEFVIKKSSAQKLGAGTLQAMNENKFATGGIVALNPYDEGPPNVRTEKAKLGITDIAGKAGQSAQEIKTLITFAKGLTGKKVSISSTLDEIAGGKQAKKVDLNLIGAAIGDKTVGEKTEAQIKKDFANTVNSSGDAIANFFGAKVTKKITEADTENLGIAGVIGNAFEGILGNIGAPFDQKSDNNAAFDFAKGLGQNIAEKLGAAQLASNPTDAKRSLNTKNLKEVGSKKFPNFYADEVKRLDKIVQEEKIQQKQAQIRQAYATNRQLGQGDAAVSRLLGISVSAAAQLRKDGAFGAVAPGKNKGGSIAGSGSGDTVPALLTPGEFVINKKSAQSIGYSNLNSMNKTGVARFAKGGTVGFQKFAEGGAATGGGGALNIVAFLTAASFAQAAIQKLGDKSDKASDKMAAWTIGLEKGVGAAIQLVGIFIAVKAVQTWTKALRDSQKEIEKGTASKEEPEQATQVGEDPRKQELQKLNEQKAAKEQQQAGIERGLDKAQTDVNIEKGLQERRISDAEARKATLQDTATRQASSISTTESALGDFKDQRDQLQVKRDAQAELVANQRPSSIVDESGTPINAQEIEQAKQKLAEMDATLAQANQTIDHTEQSITQWKSELDATNNKIKEEEKVIKDANQGTKELIEARKKEDKLKRGQKAVAEDIARIDKKSREIKTQLNAESRKRNKAERDQARYQQTLLGSTRKLGPAMKRVADDFKLGVSVSKKYVAQKAQENRIIKTTTRGYRGLKGRASNAAFALKKFDRNVLGLADSFRKAASGAKKLAAETKKQAKRGASRVRAGVGKVGGAAAGAAGAVGAIVAVGAQIAAGFQEYFKRQERIAIASENAAGAIEAAGKAAEAENFGRAFSMEGLFAGFQSTFMGDDTAVNNLANSMADNIARSRAEAGVSAANAIATSDLRRFNQGAFTTGEGDAKQTNFSAAVDRTASAQARARAEFGALSKAERDTKEAEFAQQGGQILEAFSKSGASFEELDSAAQSLAGTNLEQLEQYRKQIRVLIAARDAQQALNKANFESLKVTSAFGAASAAVSNFTAGLESGSNTLASYVAELEAAQQGIGIDASGAINAIEKDLVASAEAAGADPSLVQSLQGQASVARATNQFGVNAAGALEGLQLSTDTATAKGQLEAALLDAIPDDADDATRRKIEQQIAAQVSGIENIQTADLSQITKNVVEAGGKLSAGFQQAAALQAQHNGVMIGLYKQQEELEAAAAEAKNKAIDTQLDAAKQFEEFGGARVTGQQKLGARVAQFNNIGGLGGLGAQLTSGSAADIRQAQDQINSTFFTQQNQAQVNAQVRGAAGGGPGAFAGPQGIQDDKREEAKKANEALITFTKQRIALLKEELSIVQKKNAEEKSSLEKLISGDIEGFLEGQAAAGAGAALRSGDAGLASLFSTSALGAGFKSLEGQGLSDQQLRQAEDLTLQRFGLQGNGVLSGTTSEEEAIKAQGRELAALQGDLAGDQAAFAQAEFTIQEAIINATNATFQNKLREVSNQNRPTATSSGDVAEFARGGVVYANRGMFVPRGTDTVPAMLTPGEFVVNRGAVQRGNNLQILRAMNSGGGASAPGNMSGGGQVRYYNRGGQVENMGGISPEGITQLQGVFNTFSTAVDKLVNSQFSVKLDTTNVNVNFNGASFLNTLKEDIKNELLSEVGEQIKKAKPNQSGDMKTGNTVLGN